MYVESDKQFGQKIRDNKIFHNLWEQRSCGYIKKISVSRQREVLMDYPSKLVNEKTINNKKRVQNHGEVFTPTRIINKMLDLPAVREACQNLTLTFLEPAAGEGAFLVEVLNRKINIVGKNYGDNLTSYENYSLLALTTLYGVELLQDNVLKCVMNMYQAYYEAYQRQAGVHGKNMKGKVLDSAKLIISKNIVQGDFLTGLSYNGKPLVFSKWEATNLHEGTEILNIQRIEYTLHDIRRNIKKENDEDSTYLSKVAEQIDLFDLYTEQKVAEQGKRRVEYAPVEIVNVYKEEREEING
jgi:hypothetical protein